MTKLTFGKHKGTDIHSVPTEYLEWGALKLDSPKWREAFASEIKRRRDEEKEKKAYIKANIDTQEVLSLLYEEAEKELFLGDEDEVMRITSKDVQQRFEEKLARVKAEIELEKLNAEFCSKWGITEKQLGLIHDLSFHDELTPNRFSTTEKYESACEYLQAREDLLGIMWNL
ncbi:MAG: hypothetical protein LW708_22390 [Anabaena sp. 49628_E55]|jgi:hypothetical protein|nr:hypothetical protein [Anabaena sp. 49628_E55]